MKSLAERPKSAREGPQEPPVASLTNSEVRQVHAELERILASHHFFSSKRCQAFLRYAVAETLSGRQDLKERSIGVEVFDRNPSYDTNQDPVVRMTAGEVRKRLALHYQDAANDSGLRLDLPVGTYIPRFHFAAKGIAEPDLDVSSLESTLAANPQFISEPVAPPALAVPATIVPADAAQPPAPPNLVFHTRLKLLGPAAAVLVVLAGAALAAFRLRPAGVVEKSPIEQFWDPYLASTSPIFLSIGQIRPTHAEVEPNGLRSSVQKPIALQGEGGYPREVAVTVLGDSIAMTDMVALLRSGGKEITMRAESATSFAELQRGPNILVGAFNNDWSIMFTDPLRFHFCLKDKAQWIGDREHPEDRIGLLVMGTRMSDLKADYAIAARFYNPASKQMIVIAAGITPYGTQAAGEFLTDPASLTELARHAPPDWPHKNMEVVIKTNLIDNEVGPPTIVRSVFW